MKSKDKSKQRDRERENHNNDGGDGLIDPPILHKQVPNNDAEADHGNEHWDGDHEPVTGVVGEEYINELHCYESKGMRTEIRASIWGFWREKEKRFGGEEEWFGILISYEGLCCHVSPKFEMMCHLFVCHVSLKLRSHMMDFFILKKNI